MTRSHLIEWIEAHGGTLQGAPLTMDVTQVASLAEAEAGQMSFFDGGNVAKLRQTQASLVILEKKYAEDCPTTAVITPYPRLLFAKIAKKIQPFRRTRTPGVHPLAQVHDQAEVDPSASIGPYVSIGEGTKIGQEVVIESHTVIEHDVEIGDGCYLHPHAVIRHGSQLGKRCVIQSHAVIGADGFGYAPTPDRHWEFLPHYGHVVLEDEVEVGAGTTIDRGTFSTTHLGYGVKCDNQIQIGHNVEIGAHTVIAGCTGIAGSARIGQHCMIGGACVIAGHLSICDGVTLTGQTAVQKSIDQSGVYSSGLSAQPSVMWRRNLVRLQKLDALFRRILAKVEKHDQHDD